MYTLFYCQLIISVGTLIDILPTHLMHHKAISSIMSYCAYYNQQDKTKVIIRIFVFLIVHGIYISIKKKQSCDQYFV